MEIELQELHDLISKQKELAGVSFFGAFRDGYIAALDIVNQWAKLQWPKCVNCQAVLSEEEASESDTCDRCYERLQAEHNAESNRNR